MRDLVGRLFCLPFCFLRRIHLGFVVIGSYNWLSLTRPELFSGMNSSVVDLIQGNASARRIISVSSLSDILLFEGECNLDL